MLGKRRCDHGVILKIVSTNICATRQARRTTAEPGLVLGHEIKVIEAGKTSSYQGR
jgi:glutathione-independent formaldehyde dehydrogenase